MEKPYSNILEMLKARYNFIASSKDPSKLNNDDMTWATVLRDSLMVLEKEDITIEEAIAYLDKAIQKDANAYKNRLIK
ncbi:TPA_asm: hypothetical protein GZX72_14210 [Listeria monocytogenes]|nr:hypothetical protein [Listeria monocytogenes]